MADYDVNILSDSEADSDEELIDFVNIVHRRPYTIRYRPNHMEFWDDVDFVARFRLSKVSVQNLLESITPMIAFPTNRYGAINPLQQLLMCLRFYASANMLIGIGDFGGVHKSSVCHIIKKVTTAICTLCPRYVSLHGFYAIAAFPRVVLALDCTHVKIQSVGGAQVELFRNRKGYFSLNVQAACDDCLRFRNVVARWPGSTHDSTIFNNSFLKARFEDANDNCLILGGSGYPILNYLITPLNNPQGPAENLFNQSQIRTRNVAERAFGVWKRRYPILALGLRLKLETIQDVIIATAVLHNIAVDNHDRLPPVNQEVAMFINEAVPVPGNDEIGNGFVRNALIEDYFAGLVLREHNQY